MLCTIFHRKNMTDTFYRAPQSVRKQSQQHQHTVTPNTLVQKIFFFMYLGCKFHLNFRNFPGNSDKKVQQDVYFHMRFHMRFQIPQGLQVTFVFAVVHINIFCENSVQTFFKKAWSSIYMVKVYIIASMKSFGDFNACMRGNMVQYRCVQTNWAWFLKFLNADAFVIYFLHFLPIAAS